MNDPLCLPQSVEDWNKLRAALVGYCIECYGGVREDSVVLVETPRNSATGVFDFVYFAPVNGIDRMHRAKGNVHSAWNKDGRTYYVAQIEGKNPVKIWASEYIHGSAPSIEKERNAHHRRNSKK